MPELVSVSFVILNWNGLDDTLNCLDSIRQQTLNDYEIIVVDNGSSQDQKETLRKIEDIILVDLPNNKGFTGGHIEGLKHSKGKYIALINNDAVLARDWAEKAVTLLRNNPSAAAAGGRAYYWGKGRRAFDKTADFFSYQVVNPVTGHARTLTYGDQTVRVNSISGSAVIVRRSAINKTGYLENRFFAYYEETDLFARFKRLGMHVLYSPELCVWHKIAQSTKSMPDFYLFQMHRNRFIYAVRNFDKPFLGRFLRYYIGEFITALKRVAKHGKVNAREEYNLIRAFRWNIIRLPITLWSRWQVQKLGSTYSNKLLRDKGESIGIIIPCYNYANHVAEAIESALNQTVKPDEIIVINDGSTDNSLDVINKYKDRVKIISQPNRGVVKTKNRGLKEIGTDWVIFLDADDTLSSEYVKLLYNEARIHNADVIYSGMWFIGSDKGVFDSRPFTLRSLRHGNYINNSALMRRQSVVNAGGYSDDMDFGFEDWELYMALAEAGAKFRHINRSLFYYRRHEASSRDKIAGEKLHHAHDTIRILHPKLYTKIQIIKDLLHDLVTIHQRRSPLQVAKDFRYMFINRIDRFGDKNMAVNKLMGFGRLLSSGKFNMIWDKIKLNFRRLSRR